MHPIATTARFDVTTWRIDPRFARLDDVEETTARGPVIEIGLDAHALLRRDAGHEDRAPLAANLFDGHAFTTGRELGDRGFDDAHARHGDRALSRVTAYRRRERSLR